MAAAFSPARIGGGAATTALAGLLALTSAGLLAWLGGSLVLAGGLLAGLAAVAALMAARAGSRPAPPASAVPTLDIALLRAALDCAAEPAAVTDGDGSLRCANRAYVARFGTLAPGRIAFAGDGPARLAAAVRDAGTRGAGSAGALAGEAGSVDVDIRLHAGGGRRLIWRLAPQDGGGDGDEARRLVTGDIGARLGEAGVMAVLADAGGGLAAANAAFAARALAAGPDGAAGTPLADLILADGEGRRFLAAEGDPGAALHIVETAVRDRGEAARLLLILDEAAAGRGAGGERLHALLDFLPLGLALANGDGRFVYLNRSFRKAAGVGHDTMPPYPGDLVVDDDKAAVSDAVRRFARGRQASGDIAVRLKARPDEPVALTVAAAKGVGEAAVVLSLKDNREEDRLKRQVAQATKMQAVGQLAGGVAHDFNNILTAILGYCDLMLMRHSPGDSDYDDIQQIRSNSNRAAGLTRQLLAFSRQQTLRPQVLQLPDVISEVSNLLKRLLGETVRLQVKHGRGLGAVRADPGQLEQVIVNLAVNARDAMQAKGEGRGTLTLHTYAVAADDVRTMASDILPIADYTALRVTDTGTGIPPGLIGKIFEPFFTTKDVGKGTGLGLSTVYGIVKQSGGFIFAESPPGAGASFVIYLPVFRNAAAAEVPREKAKAKDAAGELWGSATILLVEDEAMVRTVAERALARHGYTVLVAESGEAALEILAGGEKVDLMISDVVMPSMDGPATARAARALHPDLPILFISGYAEEQLRKSLDFERVAFLAKPFSVRRLAEATRDALAAK